MGAESLRKMLPFFYTFFGGSKYNGGRQFFKIFKKIF
jgi:hypothetical protein